MTFDVNQPESGYQKPTIEELGSFAHLTLFGINPDKWSSWADVLGGTAISDGGPGGHIGS